MSQASTQDRPGYLVKQVQQLLRQECDTRLRAIELSMAQYAVLLALDEHPDVSSAELARLCFVTRQSLRDVLRGLEKAGLVSVADHPSTGRSRPVSLTPAGQERLGSADTVVSAVEEQMLHGLPDIERTRLAGLLSACASNLRRHEEL